MIKNIERVLSVRVCQGRRATAYGKNNPVDCVTFLQQTFGLKTYKHVGLLQILQVHFQLVLSKRKINLKMCFVQVYLSLNLRTFAKQ